ncbi:uncharacterized protein JN550_011557 [Neoarthrinium moseri]|uniref:uncharacterized protein n=1 Tax=Neoarthrinium moseri TaxID=1658444 RepID=UPI001FDAE5BE|nr:uncharacterized protein JN550_011557 [Neoarthrinium moseri]KAI1860291.1 hypothetical protein JN550_011557 [Neoarthrinium moseri]
MPSEPSNKPCHRLSDPAHYPQYIAAQWHLLLRDNRRWSTVFLRGEPDVNIGNQLSASMTTVSFSIFHLVSRSIFNMTTVDDFEIFRVTPEHISTTSITNQLVDVLKAATRDNIYDTLRQPVVENLSSLVQHNCGVLEAARLKGSEGGRVVGLALFKLRFRGPRQPDWTFLATPQQDELHAGIFSDDKTKTRRLVHEATGDPILTSFVESLQSGGKALREIEEDILILEPVFILPEYQHVEGLARELAKSVIRKAVASNIRVITYNRVGQHEYSSPNAIWAGFQPLYEGTRVFVQVDTRETPDWDGPEVVWDHEFQLFGTQYGQTNHYPSSAIDDLG